MRRLLCLVAAACLLCAAGLLAQDIQRGKIKKVDAEKGTIAIAIERMELSIAVCKDA